MTGLEKRQKVKYVLHDMCKNGDGCPDCIFFDPEDKTDGEYWCALRDMDGRIPSDHMWHAASAMF